MISTSLHPEPARAVCQPRGRVPLGLTPRAIWLLAAGLLLALPGFFRASWGYGMLVWDALVATGGDPGWMAVAGRAAHHRGTLVEQRAFARQRDGD